MRKNVIPTMALALVFMSAALAAPARAGENRPELDSLIADYLQVQTALAADSLQGVADLGASIAGHADNLKVDQKHQELPSATATAARKLAQAGSLDEARTAFGQLSDPVISLSELMAEDKPQVAFCPMADRSWLQKGDQIANPYYGSKMLRCGKIVQK